jgi:hypothetical protein
VYVVKRTAFKLNSKHFPKLHLFIKYEIQFGAFAIIIFKGNNGMIIVNLILLCTVQIHNVLQTCTKCMKYKHSPNILVSFCCSVPANLVCVCVYIYIYVYTHTLIHTLLCYAVQLFSGHFLCFPPPRIN